jgi:phosphatidyl-myo-inositol dimannoside synthase
MLTLLTPAVVDDGRRLEDPVHESGGVSRAAPAVVLVSEVFPPAVGGSGVLLANVYGRLTGERPTVITSDVDMPDPPEAPGVRVVRMPMRAAEWGVLAFDSLWRHVRVAGRLRRECRGRHAVVHCARAVPEGVAALMNRLRYGGPPYLCWAHGEEIVYAGTSRELRALLSRVLRRASAVVANCRNTAALLAPFGVPESAIHVVYPGVDAARFARSERAWSLRSRFAAPGQVLVLTVGRLQRRKGHELAIRACAAARRAGCDLSYVIVGNGEERGRLERLVDDVGLRQHVHFAGEVPDDRIADYYCASDIFLHPNRVETQDVEGFGIVFLEAAAAGLPAIGGNSGGVPEAIERDVTGLLVSGTDVGEIAAAIGILVNDESVRRRMGDAARTRVLRDFTWDRAAHQVAALHRTIAMQA